MTRYALASLIDIFTKGFLEPIAPSIALSNKFANKMLGAILKKWTAKSERWYNNKKRRERHGKHQVYRGIQAKHSKLV